jgi:hypothetical protein
MQFLLYINREIVVIPVTYQGQPYIPQKNNRGKNKKSYIRKDVKNKIIYLPIL